MTVDDWKKYIKDNDIYLSHVKDVVDQLDVDMASLKTTFDVVIPNMRKLEAVAHEDPNVVATLTGNMTLELVYACKDTIGMRNRVDTLNTIPMLLTMNQMDLAQVEFRGGENPGFHVGRIHEESVSNGFNKPFADIPEDDDDWIEEYDSRVMKIKSYNTQREKEMSVMVCVGLPIFSDLDLDVLKDEYGVADVVAAAPDAVNLAHICAGALDLKMVQKKGKKKVEMVYHKFGDTKTFHLAKPFVDNTLTIPTMSICRQKFELPTMSKEAMVHEVASYVTAHPEILETIPRSPIQKIAYKNGYKNVEFTKMPLPQLEDMWSKLRSMAARFLTLLKNHDTGFAALNAPLKWSPVLAYMQGESPYFKDDESNLYANADYRRTDSVAYYGAAGGRMDALMHSYFLKVFGRDITAFNATSKKLSEDELRKLKIPRWDFGDITAYNRGVEDCMVSDVYMKAWGGANGNAIMCKFIAGLMRGKIVVGNDERDFGSTENFKLAAKMMLPLKSNLVEFDGCYPFVMANTCRPTTSEIILIKSWEENYDNDDDHDELVQAITEHFRDNTMDDRFTVIRDRKEFEHMIKLKLAAQLSELFMHLDRLCVDWTRPINSQRCRGWFLAGPQLPNLFRTLKINLETGSNSWSFDPVMSELLGIDLDGFRLGLDRVRELVEGVSEDEEEVLEKPEKKKKAEPKVSKVFLKTFDKNIRL